MPLEFHVPEDFSVVTPEQLNELDAQARAAASPLVDAVNGGQSLSDDDLGTLERLSGVVTNVRAERERRLAEAAAATATADRTKSAVSAFADTTPDTPVTTEPVETPPADPAPEAPAGDTSADNPEDGDVAKNTPRVADIAGGTPAPAGPNGDGDARQSYTRMVAASTAPGYLPGAEFADWSDAGKALEAAMASFSGLGKGQHVKIPVVQFKREYPEHLRVNASDNEGTILDKFDAAAKESDLPGGSLVAAAGWCAPSEILYDLFEIGESNDGMLSMPELQVNRGGFQFTPGPDFASIFGGSGYFHQTEAQVIAATSKPCMVVPCPSFTEVRLEVEGVCITGAFLQDRGYPEMVKRFGRGAMAVHKRKMNIFKINKVVSGSTLFDYTNVANLPVTTSESKDFSALSRLLAVVGIQIEDYRNKYRMGFNETLEAVMPHWVIESMRADVQRRTGLNDTDAFNLAQTEIEQWFRVRGARVQWVYDWLDTYNTTNQTTVGQTAGVYTLPTTVEVLLYAAGTWVAGVSDVIRLDAVYDSANLALNQYTQLFTEEGILVAKRGFESRRLKATISPSGVTSATTDMRTG